MLWNYRVIVKDTIDLTGVIFKDFAIHEVYYEDDGSIKFITTDPITIDGESLEDLKESISMVQGALDKPIIEDQWPEEEEQQNGS
jgi:hypothetical protein